MPTTITFAAKKGGVGKSTMSWNLAAYLASNGSRVLLIETDSQGSLAKCLLGPEEAEMLQAQQTTAALFDERLAPEPEQMIHDTYLDNMFLVPATDHLAPFVEPKYRECGELQFALAQFIAEVSTHVDYVICDSPPSIDNLMAWNCLMAANYVVSLTPPKTFAVHSCEGMTRKIVEAATYGNAKLQNLGFAVTQKNNRTNDAAAYESVLRSVHGTLVFDSVMTSLEGPYESAIASGRDIINYDSKSEAARQLVSFFDEILERIEKHQTTTSTLGRAA